MPRLTTGPRCATSSISSSRVQHLKQAAVICTLSTSHRTDDQHSNKRTYKVSVSQHSNFTAAACRASPQAPGAPPQTLCYSSPAWWTALHTPRCSPAQQHTASVMAARSPVVVTQATGSAAAANADDSVLMLLLCGLRLCRSFAS